jgi:aromatic ring-opening dioxygenase LigB subunit
MRVSVAAEAGEGHREKSDGPYGKGDRIKIHQGA